MFWWQHCEKCTPICGNNDWNGCCLHARQVARGVTAEMKFTKENPVAAYNKCRLKNRIFSRVLINPAGAAAQTKVNSLPLLIVHVYQTGNVYYTLELDFESVDINEPPRTVSHLFTFCICVWCSPLPDRGYRHQPLSISAKNPTKAMITYDFTVICQNFHNAQFFLPKARALPY